MIEEMALDAEQAANQYQTMQKIVTDYLRSAIISGRFGPGERLNQDDIAKQLRVSRMPVREALRILQSEGSSSSSLIVRRLWSACGRKT